MSKPLFLKDSNIEENEIDAFGVHSNFAKSIVKIIDQVDIKNSAFTLGLFGHWGSGKSFIIKELKKIIKNENKQFEVFTIDVWKFVDQPLLRSILFQLSEHLSGKDKNNYKEQLQKRLYSNKTVSELEKKDWKKQLKELKEGIDYGSVLISLISLAILITLIFAIGNLLGTENNLFNTSVKIMLPLLGYFVAFIARPFSILLNGVNIANYSLAANFSPEQFEDLFEEFIKKYIKNEKAIIIFDNIDRCSSQLAYETLSTLKTYIDKKGCFYIIPCDDEAIKEHLLKGNPQTIREGTSDEFLKKIFDTSIRIPSLNVHDKDSFIATQLNKLSISEELTSKDLSQMKQILFYAFQNDTPRQIKRSINEICSYYELAKQIDTNKKNILKHFPTFIIMVAIKQKWVEFENILLQEPDLLTNYYTNEHFKNDIVNTKKYNIDKTLIEFMDSVEYYYSLDTNVKPFIFLKDISFEKDFKEDIINGKILNIENKIDELTIDKQIEIFIQHNEYINQTLLSLYNTLINCNNRDNYPMLYKRFIDILFSENNDIELFIKNNINTLNKLFDLLKKDKKYIIKIRNIIKKIFVNDNNKFSPDLIEKLFNLVMAEPLIFKDNDITDCITISIIENNSLGNDLLNILKDKQKLNLISEKVISEFINKTDIRSNLNILIERLSIIKGYANFPINIQIQLIEKSNALMTRMFSASNPTNDANALDVMLSFVVNIPEIEKYSQNYSSFKTNYYNFMQRNYNSVYIGPICQFVKFISNTNEQSIFMNRIEHLRLSNVINYMDKTCIQAMWNIEEIKMKYIISEYQDSLNILLNRFPDFINENYLEFIIQNGAINITNLRRIFIAIKEQKHGINLSIKDIGIYVCQKIKEQKMDTIKEIIKLFEEFEYKPLKKYFNNDKGFVHLIITDYYDNFNTEIIKKLQSITELEDWTKTYIVPIYTRIHDEAVKQNKNVSMYLNSTCFITSNFVNTHKILLDELIKSLLIDTKSKDEHQFAIDVIGKLNEYGLLRNGDYKDEFELVKNNLTGPQQDYLKELGVNL